MNWQEKFAPALSYSAFLDAYARLEDRQRWKKAYDQIELTQAQILLLQGFARRMNVLCLAGAWCGDCVNQCPILQRFAETGRAIDLRFLDRDAHMDVQRELSINGGNRVPVVVFLSEDFLECARYGDRTVSQYREMARTHLGPACPAGLGPLETSSVQAMTRDWLAEFERIQLLLRLSARLRAEHGD